MQDKWELKRLGQQVQNGLAKVAAARLFKEREVDGIIQDTLIVFVCAQRAMHV